MVIYEKDLIPNKGVLFKGFIKISKLVQKPNITTYISLILYVVLCLSRQGR